MTYQVSDILNEFLIMTGNTEKTVADRISRVYPIGTSTVGHWRTGRTRPKVNRLDWIAKQLRYRDEPISVLCELMRDAIKADNGATHQG